MDPVRFPILIKSLYGIVSELEEMFGRPFTPDGHMVGSIGEALVAHHYGLILTPPSTPGCDAKTSDGRSVEIKATQGNKVAFRCKPEHLIVLRINRDGTFEEIYNGRGDRAWGLVSHKGMPSNGQLQISLAALRKLNQQVAEGERIPRAL